MGIGWAVLRFTIGVAAASLTYWAGKGNRKWGGWKGYCYGAGIYLRGYRHRVLLSALDTKDFMYANSFYISYLLRDAILSLGILQLVN